MTKGWYTNKHLGAVYLLRPDGKRVPNSAIKDFPKGRGRRAVP